MKVLIEKVKFVTLDRILASRGTALPVLEFQRFLNFVKIPTEPQTN